MPVKPENKKPCLECGHPNGSKYQLCRQHYLKMNYRRNKDNRKCVNCRWRVMPFCWCALLTKFVGPTDVCRGFQRRPNGTR
jgi:hypothetical protein